MKVTVFTHMTNPELRNDPWREAMECFNDIGEEVVVVGENWPTEFKWDYIGKVFQEGFDKSRGDWVINMPIDYIIHEKDIDKIIEFLTLHADEPAVSFPQHQFFTPDRYRVQSKLCIALNKKKFPHIKLNGGGDLCLPTINGNRILPEAVPQINVPIWNYDKVFGTRETIANDRARFARAWFRQFNEWGIFGGSTPEEAFNAWMLMVESRYKKHILRVDINQHPKYLRKNLDNLNNSQFGYDAFGLKGAVKTNIIEYFIAYKNKYFR